MRVAVGRSELAAVLVVVRPEGEMGSRAGASALTSSIGISCDHSLRSVRRSRLRGRLGSSATSDVTYPPSSSRSNSGGRRI